MAHKTKTLETVKAASKKTKTAVNAVNAVNAVKAVKSVKAPMLPQIDQPIVLIDLSNFIFHRWYAVMTWCKLSKQTIEDTPECKQTLYDKFTKTFEETLLQVQKRNKTDWMNIILAKDCPREAIWRMQLYPEYKATRDCTTNAEFDPQIFTMAYESIIPELLKKYPDLRLIGHPRAEADDIIAVAHAYYRAAYPHRVIEIISNDADFVQLADDHTRIISNGKKDVVAKFTKEQLAHYLEWKIIKGDMGDNIRAIDAKIGDKTALALAMNPDALRKRLDKPGVQEKYIMNQKLISFAHIPEDIRKQIMQKMEST
jgi:5'-3' exonuclease